MAQDPLTVRMGKIRQQAGERLDRMAEAMPPARYDRTPPFDQYMQRAQRRAATDPDFARRLDSALQQYRAAQEIGG